jgi:predicted metal-dependent phosphoesterase TrpH
MGPLEPLGTADLHLHTSYSDGVASLGRLLEHVERSTTLDVIAVTDHDDLRGGLEARELAARRGYRFEVVPGMEVTTREGHLIALFLEAPVPSFETLERTVARVHELGGLCVVPHPLARIVPSVSARAFARVLARPDPADRFDAIELSRGTFAAARAEARARALNERYGLAEVGSSDAHFLPVVGTAYTVFPGRTAAALRRALVERTTRSAAGRAVPLRQIPLDDLVRMQWRGAVLLPLRRARMRWSAPAAVPALRAADGVWVDASARR